MYCKRRLTTKCETANKTYIVIKNESTSEPAVTNDLSNKTEESETNSNEELSNRELCFHPRCGRNAFITNEGKDVVKRFRSDSEYPRLRKTAAFTNRPLRDNEIFTVRIMNKTFARWCFAIGVISKSPKYIQILDEMLESRDAWTYYDTQIYSNGWMTSGNYGRSTRVLEPSQTLGVMKNEFGELYFYFDGVNQGMAAKMLPSEVYGFFEMGRSGIRASIVDS